MEEAPPMAAAAAPAGPAKTVMLGLGGQDDGFPIVGWIVAKMVRGLVRRLGWRLPGYPRLHAGKLRVHGSDRRRFRCQRAQRAGDGL